MRPRSQASRRLAILAVAIASIIFPAFISRAHGDVYYYKDADGVFHFTNVARPDALPFMVDKPLGSPESDEEARADIPDSRSYDRIIDKVAKRFNVEPELVKAVIRAESGFNRMAVSSCGARGLMQLMPDTARSHGVRNVWDAEQNIVGGVKHLRLLLDRHGRSLPRVLAAYNAGSLAVDRHRGIPPIQETQDYVARVLRYRQEYLKKDRIAQVASNS